MLAIISFHASTLPLLPFPRCIMGGHSSWLFLAASWEVRSWLFLFDLVWEIFYSAAVSLHHGAAYFRPTPACMGHEGAVHSTLSCYCSCIKGLLLKDSIRQQLALDLLCVPCASCCATLRRISGPQSCDLLLVIPPPSIMLWSLGLLNGGVSMLLLI
jgi:hypothetical protein